MFKITSEDGDARTGILRTEHGRIETPSFMPVATKGAVKHVTTEELKEMGTRSIISNAFLLYLRPGPEVIEAHHGLHRFMDWDRSIFTDCGGFQVLSLEKDFHLRTSIRGIEFKSPFDGKKHLLTPELTIEIQSRIGSDVAMALDHMPLSGCTREDAAQSLSHTHEWMARCKKLHENNKQLLFGICQGSIFPDLRKKSARYIDSLDFDGIAFGGLAIGEPQKKMLEMIKICSGNVSRDKPRYVMGLGSPESILKSISLGVDTFDSVYPTRNARHAHLFTKDGPINIDNAAFRNDIRPVSSDCGCFVCRKHSRAYLSHLFRTKEPLGKRLASYHNLSFMQGMMKDVRNAIRENSYPRFMKGFLRRYNGRL